MKLEELRERIKKAGLDGLYIPRSSMFIGQDILPEENHIMELTGFTGSAGNLVATANKAYLAVDGRYEIQADMEVDKNKVEIIKKLPITAALKDIDSETKKEFRIGFNPWTVPFKEIDRFEKITEKMKFVPADIVGGEKVSKDIKPFELSLEFAGISREEKLAVIAGFLIQRNLDLYIFTAADSVSWLFNLRSNYLPTSPVFRGYALVDRQANAIIFSNDLKDGDIKLASNIKILPVLEIEKEIKKNKNKALAWDYENTPYAVNSLTEKYNLNVSFVPDPCVRLKAVKNPVEIAGMKKAHIRDGAAVTKLLYWLNKNPENKTELDIAEKLREFRSAQKNYFSDSFDTIAGFAGNGAIVHYHPTPKTNKQIKKGSFLLLDSGGQYFDGTTDATRTIPIGEVTREMKDNYTLVLKSHIALARCIFPKKTNGIALDGIARNILWSKGKNYEHGTGHGVGFFLNVHEGPQSISIRGRFEPLEEDMIVSIEPGYYKENNYGIRIENLYAIVRGENPGFENEMLGFEYLTLIPIDKNAINDNLLCEEELNWLENYNRSVYNAISSFLNEDEKKWLSSMCG